MAIAKDTEDLEVLLYGKKTSKKGTTAKTPPIPVDTEAAGIEETPVFQYDPIADRKSITKMVRRTVTSMAEHIIPDDMLSDDYVKNKMEQDINTLTELYTNRKNHEVILQSLITRISRGDTSPKMYEMYTKMTDTINENNKQILATEDNLRKTYMELKYEVQSKRAESANELPTFGMIPQQQKIDNGNRSYTGSKSLLEKMKEKQRANARKEKANVEDVSFA